MLGCSGYRTYEKQSLTSVQSHIPRDLDVLSPDLRLVSFDSPLRSLGLLESVWISGKASSVRVHSAHGPMLVSSFRTADHRTLSVLRTAVPTKLFCGAAVLEVLRSTAALLYTRTCRLLLYLV